MIGRVESRVGIVTAAIVVALLGVPGEAQHAAQAPSGGKPHALPAAGAATTGAGSVSGVVLDVAAGKPASRALVMIAATDRGLIRTIATDTTGHFSIDALPAGHYLLAAGKPTFIAAMFGAGRISGAGASIDLAEHERRHDVTIALTRGAVIAGRVLDADGAPLSNVRVRVSQRRDVAGEVTVTGDLGDPVGAVTDDQGSYRIFDLEPGVYTVAAQPRSNPGAVRSVATPDDGARLTAYRPIYFPSAATARDSQPIELSAGQVREDVDLHTSLVDVARVSGVVTRNGAPDSSGAAQVSLRPVGGGAGTILGVFNTRAGADGRFSIANVPPGEYRAFARVAPPAPAAPAAPPAQFFAIAGVSVQGRDVSDLALALTTGASLAGHVVFEGLPGLPNDIGSVRVSIRATPGSAVPFTPDTVTTDAHANFTIAGVAPGKYRLFVQVPNNNVTQAPDWYAKTAALDGADAFDVPFEVTPGQSLKNLTLLLTDDEQEIDGQVRDGGAKPAVGASVIAFSADRRDWFQGSRRIVVRQTDARGAYVFGLSAALPVGEYFVAAVPAMALGPNDQFDPALLETLSKSAARVTLGANDTRTADLKIDRR